MMFQVAAGVILAYIIIRFRRAILALLLLPLLLPLALFFRIEFGWLPEYSAALKRIGISDGWALVTLATIIVCVVVLFIVW